jgi:4-aminobutyrate aminotransferase
MLMQPQRPPQEIPMATMTRSETNTRALSPVLGRYFERTWVRGEGHHLWDDQGKRYLDFGCGIATTGLGHRHPAVTAAIHAQVDRLVHVSSGLGYVESVNLLAERLAATCPAPLDTVFLGNSGAEAIEAAMKLSRRVTGRPGYIAFRDAFHGRTFGAASLTSSNLNYRAGYEPLLPGVVLAPFPDVHRDPAEATAEALAALDSLFEGVVPATEIAAIVVEPVQGEGGIKPAPAAFLRGLRERCDRHGILLVIDEIQTGLARTGRMWAFEAADIVPDVICFGKAIANGLPLGGIVSPRALQDRWGVGAHGTTFGGNPVACAAAVAVLETIEGQDLAANAATQGATLMRGLSDLATRDPRLTQVRGAGLMIGVEAGADLAPRLMDGCADAGLIVLLAGGTHDVVRWLPPLDVTADEIGEALAIFEGVLAAA